jgi:hypothetical protein
VALNRIDAPTGIETSRQVTHRGIARVRDNRAFLFFEMSLHMTVITQPSLPQGYVELTEGRIRTTDLVFGNASNEWREPHAFVVGSDIGEEGTKVARRVVTSSKSARPRS